MSPEEKKLSKYREEKDRGKDEREKSYEIIELRPKT